MSVNSIVQVNVSEIVAPTPATLQQTGAIVCEGGTLLTPGSHLFLSQLSDLLPYLQTPAAVTSAIVSSTTTTVTTAAPHGLPSGGVYVTLSGFTPTWLNNSWFVTPTGASTFTFTQPAGYTSATVEGTWVVTDSISVVKKATTFFAQGANLGVYVLELGLLTPVDAITALSNYLIQNPNSDYVPGAQGYFYAYLLPKNWTNLPSLLTLLASYENTTARTYFFITATLSNYTVFTNLMKCAFVLIESPPMAVYNQNVVTAASFVLYQGEYYITATTTTPHGVPVGAYFTMAGFTPATYNGTFQALAGTTGSTLIWSMTTNPGVETALGRLVASSISNPGVGANEFSLAAPFWNLLHYQPSTTNRVTPMEYSFVFGVTPFPTQGQGSLVTTLKNAYINIIGTGAEGGISNTITLWGTTKDGHDIASYWYSVDWVQINLDLDTANAIINGNNNPINPTYYNQPGIDFIQSVAAATMTRAITYGLCLGDVVQTALDGPVLGANLDQGLYAGKTVVNAVPFVTYSLENPSDYKLRVYRGYSVVYTPQNGFSQIVYNVAVTELISY